MAVVKMKKVAVIAHRSKKEELIDFLHKEGVMEISDATFPTDIDHTEVRFRGAELDFAIARLREVASKETLAAVAKKPSEELIMKAALGTDVADIIEKVHALEQDDAQAKKELGEVGKPVFMEKEAGVVADEGAYLTSSSIREDLSRFGGGVMSLPTMSAEEMKLKDAELKKRIEENQAKRVQLSQELPKLMLARNYLTWLNQKQGVREAMQETRSTVTLFGWIAKNLFEPLEKKLHKLSPATALIEVEPKSGEHAPVQLKNPKWMEPFESVTNLYGLPQASEIDPTPLLAPFFILFFGLCLTDAGYGFTLALIMGIYLLVTKKGIKEAKLWWLLFFGGIFTFLVSIPFGGWFGLTPVQMQALIPQFVVDTNGDGVADLFKGQIWNLGATPGINFFRNLSLALGIIHLSFGIFLAGFVKWRNGEKAAAFWVDWTTLILFVAVGAYFFVPAEMKQNSLYAIYASAALVFWGKGHGSKLYLRPLSGALGVLNLAMSMLSNTLSYLRLLALGLVTGALALAVNLVASQMSAMLPIFIGIPVAILIYVLGHTMNLALNTLGAFIHSGRLQFVEFFGNFFEGGGRPFTPFKRSLHA
jgi:V/A-type H+/Na+-transporting ATPase subunit I